MRRFATLTLVIALTAVLSAHAGDAVDYGKGVSLDTAVPVETLLANPDDYLGKQVRVDGVITGVCKKRGCWMQVTNPDTGNGVRIKVDDGVIVFPYTAMGKKASAEGVFDAIVLSPEQIEARAAAEAAEHGHEPGEDCDKDGPKAERGAGCGADVVEDRIFLIRGTGAVIYS
jgi:hypothetical protein